MRPSTSVRLSDGTSTRSTGSASGAGSRSRSTASTRRYGWRSSVQASAASRARDTSTRSSRIRMSRTHGGHELEPPDETTTTACVSKSTSSSDRNAPGSVGGSPSADGSSFGTLSAHACSAVPSSMATSRSMKPTDGSMPARQPSARASTVTGPSSGPELPTPPPQAARNNAATTSVVRNGIRVTVVLLDREVPLLVPLRAWTPSTAETLQDRDRPGRGRRSRRCRLRGRGPSGRRRGPRRPGAVSWPTR